MNRRLIIYIIFLICYTLTAILFFLMLPFSRDLFFHFLLSFAGMLGLIFINIKNYGTFIKFFTLLSFIYYGLASYLTLLISLIRRDIGVFDNMGVLASTEGFLFFFVCCYFFFKPNGKS